jgi:hypothetical protein
MLFSLSSFRWFVCSRRTQINQFDNGPCGDETTVALVGHAVILNDCLFPRFSGDTDAPAQGNVWSGGAGVCSAFSTGERLWPNGPLPRAASCRSEDSEVRKAVLAYEKIGEGEKHYIVTPLGNAFELDEAELKRRVPSSK